MESFFELHASLFLDTPELMQDFQSIMTYEKYPKHHILHEEGFICNHFYVIISRIARVYYYKEDKDITCYFSTEGETITAIDSFIQRKKSKYNVEALEDLEVYKIAHSDLEELFQKHPEYERFGRLFMQHAYIELVQRIDDIQLQTAQERYHLLLQKKPELFQRVSSKNIATFLGMTPETFSRIRGK